LGGTQNELNDVYAIRCAFDHLNDIDPTLDSKVMPLANRAEKIARSAFQRVILNDLQHYYDDDKIRAFWNDSSNGLLLVRDMREGGFL
ncbi:MAG: hypothetical protein KKH83_01710, partial [Candidatus Margulisbacteria bacterium]|nr:hypothetical protein [Candidatus Margulisiibacteriota bacterium]